MILPNEIVYAILGALGSWMLFVTNQLLKIDRSVKFINKNLYFVDWDKVPAKKLNEVFKP